MKSFNYFLFPQSDGIYLWTSSTTFVKPMPPSSRHTPAPAPKLPEEPQGWGCSLLEYVRHERCTAIKQSISTQLPPQLCQAS